MLLSVYLGGCLVTSAALSFFRRSSAPLVLLAGALWPVLVVGGVQLACIMFVAERMRAGSSAGAGIVREAEVELSSC